MEENELKKIYNIFQSGVYFFLILDILIFVFYRKNIVDNIIIEKFAKIGIFQNLLYAKAGLLFVILLLAIGATPKKKLEIDPIKAILFPILIGFILWAIGIYAWTESKFNGLETWDYVYIGTIFIGAIILNVGFNNISKILKDNLLKDRFNVESETFQQNRHLEENKYSINYPIRFKYKKMQKGWINLTNPFRGAIVIGTPGSGKSFSIVNPYIKQTIKKDYTGIIYDFKFPDLAEVAYHHYLQKRKYEQNYNYDFHIINIDDVEYSRRVNPIRADYIDTIGKAQETAEALIEALKKGVKASGDSQFFDVSARNFLTAVFYFFAKYEDGKYSNLPFILHFLDLDYETMFNILFTNQELHSILTPFKSAFINKTFKQLEGQLGTVRINLSALNTKETNWVFGEDEIDLRISHHDNPALIILANSPETQSSNSTVLSVLINRLIKLVNSKGNIQTTLIVDEVPTIYLHKIENLIATARSNKVAVLLGLQEITQFRQQYGKEISDTILSVIANIFSGQVHSKETTEYLQNIFGKTKMLKKGIGIDYHKTNLNLNEHSDYLIPTSKIAALKTGQMIARVASDNPNEEFETSFFNCTVDLDLQAIKKEEKEYETNSLPKYYKFGNKEKQLLQNFLNIKKQVERVTDKIMKENGY